MSARTSAAARMLVLLTTATMALGACGGGGAATTSAPTTAGGGGAATASPDGGTAADTPEATEAATGGTGLVGSNPWLAAWKWDQLNWYTFNNSEGKLVKLAYSTATKDGAQVISLVTTIDGAELQQSYYDKTTRAFISGSYTIGGMKQDMTASDVDGLSWDAARTFDPGDLGSDAVKGPESITIAKGTFQCTKYDDGAFSQYWVCDGVPLPLRYHTSVTDVTWEPLDWG